jgi:predicted Zn-dependent protease
MATRRPLTTAARVRATCGLTATLILAICTLRPYAQNTPVMAAMADELARSMRELRMKDQPAPYYIEYEVWDRAQTRVSARLGSLVEDLNGKGRTLRVGVRVGGYDFDSSLFNAPGTNGGGVVTLASDGSITATLDDDYDSMRRQLWLATDAAYKRAVSIFARKKAAFQNRAAGTDVIPDFSKEAPVQTMSTGLPLEYVNRDWPDRVRQISAAFSDVPAIENSDVQVGDTRGTRYFLNSEGFKVVAPLEIASVRVTADARATDGTSLRDTFTLVERTLKELPPVSEITARAKAMAEHLNTLRSAPIAEEYAGPVLLEGDASAQLVTQVMLPPMLARRSPESAGRGRGGAAPTVTPFLRRVGLRVLAEPFSMSDTPSLREFEGRPVPGAYVVDDYGLKAKDVSLVEKGRLVTLLTGRTPLKGFLQSNGHTRGGDVQPSVIQVQSSEAVSRSELRSKYLGLLKSQDREFGYIIRSLASAGDVPGAGGGGPVILDAVKVTRDGKETPVRGLRLATVAPATFKDLLDASKERTLYNFRGTSVDAISVISPDLIFEELEIQQTREITQKPPVVKSPLGGS